MDPSKLSPEMRAEVEAVRESIRRHKRAIGPVVEVSPADNFPIGVDDNSNPFPASQKWAADRETAAGVQGEGRAVLRQAALDGGVASHGVLDGLWLAVFAAWLGDGLGRLVQSLTWAEIREIHGERGIGRLDPHVREESMSDGGVSLMALTLDGLIRADRARVDQQDDPIAELERVYRLWAADEARGSSAGGWLAADRLASQLAESRAVVLLRKKLIDKSELYQDPSVSPLLSVIPMSGWSSEASEVLDLVARAMQLTGQSAEMTVAAKAIAVVIQQNIMDGDCLRGISYVAEVDPDELGEGGAKIRDAIDAARGLARPGIAPGEIEFLGSGEAPSSALAIAVCAVLSAEKSRLDVRFDDTLRIAVNRSGNSALTGALAGAILASGYRSCGIDSPWGKGLADYRLISRLARDVRDQFGSEGLDDAKWQARYPALTGENSSTVQQDIGEEPPEDAAAAPTLIGVYSLASRGEPERVAEFRWSAEAGATVEVFDDEWGSVALSYYKRGALLVSEQRDVMPSEGPEFMRALLKRGGGSYYVFVDESAQNEPEGRRTGDMEGDMGQSQGVEMTALEQAIGRYAAEQGPVEDVYREFLIADLWALTGPDGTSSHPADFQMQGQEKAQIWVCTDRSAMPDFGGAEFVSGTVRVNGYRLLPLLAERNVQIFTQGDQMDLMIIGSRAIEISAPEITEAMRAAAAQQPGSWFSVPDQMYREAAREEVPEQAWIGAYWVDEDGTLTGRYRLNSDYRPSPTTLGFPRPESMLESVLHMWSAGYVSDRSMLMTVARSEIALLAHEDGTPGTVNLGGKTAFLAGSSPKYLPESQAKVRADVAQLKSAFDEVDLVIDVGTRHQADIQGKALLRAFEAIAAEEAQPDQGGESGDAPANVVPEAPPQAPAPPLDPRERFIGSMLAGAVGDALGYAIEFHGIGMIRQNHGDAGLTAPVLRDGIAQISDDTQMMLFTLEGLIRAHVARRIKPVDNDPVPEVQHAYQRWFHTQNQPWPQAGGPYAQRIPQPDGWLITNPQLFAARAPGSTCMSALAQFAQTHQHASPQHRINDSKGCGGVMRAAPVAVWSHDPAEVFYAAVGTAALTHSHPSGYLSAGVLAVIVHQLIRDVPLGEAVRIARELLLRWRGHEEQLAILDRAVELAQQGPVSPEVIKDTLGQGWVGEEALAIGLYAALATDNLRDALLLAVNHSGDSDSTGIVCGNIAGALHGARAVPPEWLGSLELREVIETLAGDALAEFSPGPPTDPAWTRRYPAW
ncbi:ADP-ribosylglycohydrolase [Saccharopolyspora antimicrobica]|uniref:ADP-ribosylglycohydrolase n=2 Tax=Saccharopolyspora antimicrobica TaxID=455193 RepID=A0A1I5DNC3_9PSEU|nr:ADP-ribosylglycohydrolase [Saccharopolyspora antimicrobica]SFO00676.1 ADP-ribosylglycohydrolase [Saccharopolyspora antimicrobica]